MTNKLHSQNPVNKSSNPKEGLIIFFSLVNIIFLGIILGGIAFISFLSSFNPSFQPVIIKYLNQQIPQLSGKEILIFRIGTLISFIIDGVFFISGLGLLNRKQWARRLNIYLCFGLGILMMLYLLLNKSLPGYLWGYFVYYLASVLYFTNKKLDSYFS